MLDDIPPSDRALIDEFLAKKKVTKVPMGASGLPGYEWTGKKLESKDPQAAGWRGQVRGRKRGTTPEVAQRRLRVSDLIHDGKSVQDAADVLGVTLSVIYADCKVLGLGVARQVKPKKADAAKSRFDPRVAKNREKIRKCFDGEKSAADISRETGIHIRTVKGHLSALGMTPPAPHRRVVPAASVRREMLPDLVAQGLTTQELADHFDISRSSISADCRALGLEPRRPATTTRQSAVAKRREAVRDLVAAGLTGNAIASRLGISRGTVHKDCSVLGIVIPRYGQGLQSAKRRFTTADFPNLAKAVARLPDDLRQSVEAAIAEDLVA